MAVSSSCPSAVHLQTLLNGSPGASQQIADHLRHCSDCRRLATPAQLARLGLAAPTSNELPTLDPATAATTPSKHADQIDFLSPPHSADEMGRLGHYRVLRVVGQGGMGIVFHAEDLQLRRPVALKVIKPAAAADPAFRERFLREARATAALKSDHIITIHHVGEDNGVLFLAMELLQGEPLDNWLKRGCRPTLAQLLRIAREMTLALKAAHAKGLIHRDVKPSNTWLEHPSGRVKLLDFGLVHAAEDARLTVSGTPVGTPAFMAPEQARGEPVDCRCDLFSLGVVLYELCTGTLPFRGNTIMAVLSALSSHHPPPVTEINQVLPPALSELVSQLLAKDRAARPASAQAVLEVLNRIRADSQAASNIPVAQAVPVAVAVATQEIHSSDRTIPLLPGRPAGLRRWVLIAGVLCSGLLLVVLAGAALIFSRVDRERAVPKPNAPDVPTSVGNPPVADEWFQRVSTMPVPAQQVRAVTLRLKDLNPTFAGKPTPTIDQGVVSGLQLRTDRIADLSPLRALTALEELTLSGTDGPDEQPRGQVVDLAPLRGLPLKSFTCESNPVSDLSPLQGMKLTRLSLYYCVKVKSLEPLRGMPLTFVGLPYCSQVSDLSPLQDMPITELDVGGTAIADLRPVRKMPLSRVILWSCANVTDLSPLRGKSLTDLSLGYCANVKDLSPLSGMPLLNLNIVGCGDRQDLTPLKGLQLETIELNPRTVTRGMDILRSMKSLKSIDISGDQKFTPEEFWKKYDAGEFKP